MRSVTVRTPVHSSENEAPMNLPAHIRVAARIVVRTTRLVAVAVVLSTLAATFVAPSASAHPLGNFTINRYGGLTVGPEAVLVDHVLDLAEIPALQERQRMDFDRDGAVSDAEGAAWAEASCRTGSADLQILRDGVRVALEPTAVGLTFPAGQAGLVTLRLVCAYEGRHDVLRESTRMEFRDESFPNRPGWREIVVRGDGVTVSGADAFASAVSDRLTSYPEALLQAPPVEFEAVFTVTPGGDPAPAAAIPDAVPMGSAPELIMRSNAGTAVVPAGVDLPPELSAIIEARDLTPAAIVLSLAVAMLVGAVHAASPGHGKTLMAAYLVGTRGTVRHALGLGLTVTISHTVGVLALGAIIIFAGAFMPSERLFPLLGLVSGLIVTSLGVILLVQRIRQSRRSGVQHEWEHGEAHNHDHNGHGDHEPSHADHDGDHRNTSDGWHSHGLVRHTHLPPAGNPLQWRNLVALGLVGGLVPSASAILILVGSIAAGRPAYGMFLTLGFGFGMAVVMVALGVLLVRARSFVERLPSGDRLAPLFARLPLVTAVVFLMVGAAITFQAVVQLS